MVSYNKFSVEINVLEPSYVQIPVFDFPNWTVYSNGKEIEHDNKSTLGRISLHLQPGNYQIQGIFKDTLIRVIANSLTLISLVFVLLIWLNKKLLQKLI